MTTGAATGRVLCARPPTPYRTSTRPIHRHQQTNQYHSYKTNTTTPTNELISLGPRQNEANPGGRQRPVHRDGIAPAEEPEEPAKGTNPKTGKREQEAPASGRNTTEGGAKEQDDRGAKNTGESQGKRQGM